ncbi:MAG TPA: helicase HerA-like domain-containing protein [Acidobacteriota bacterium]|nr:helicase HerA-like domain-containing protein [Acidobacteriota bacterium]
MTNAFIATSKNSNARIQYDLNNLTRHAVVVGSTGSGKTVMAKALVEEALIQGIPVIAIDPKGDIGSLGITHKQFDFRPFGNLTTANAQKTAALYAAKHDLLKLDRKNIEKLQQTNTSIYTPKSTVGKSVSFLPKLTCPSNFDAEDITSVSSLVDPVANALSSLAGFSGKSAQKIEAFIAAIIIANWSAGKDLTINDIVAHLVQPPFTTLGSLGVEDVLPIKERKKIAAQFNVVLSSPAKRVWAQGEELSIEKLFKKNTLSVFDLRYVTDLEEKQFVVEIILQEVYRFLISKGGSEELKYILYIDELAGFVPPPPANPTTKRQLELLIRQARAFGLGVIVATQNPGDIDYKILSNIGTRFVGKLRTELDVEKVAAGMEVNPSDLKRQVAALQTGEFIYNNSVKNTMQHIASRWLYSYHGGPLSLQEIGWINNPTTQPQKDKTFVVDKNAHEPLPKRVAKDVEADVVLQQTQMGSGPHDLNASSHAVLSAIVNEIKPKTDTISLKIAISDSEIVTPHIRINVEAKERDGMKFPIQGPFIFDLCSKLIPLDNYLKEFQFRTFVRDDIVIQRPTLAPTQAINYAVSAAKQALKQPYYYSKLLRTSDVKREIIVEKTIAALKDKEARKYHAISDRLDRSVTNLQNRINAISDERSSIKSRLFKEKTGRFLKRLFGNKKVASHTSQLSSMSSKKDLMKKQIKRLDEKIDQAKRKAKLDLAFLDEQVKKKALSYIHEEYFLPKDEDLRVAATILLVPKRLATMKL